ncbi:hypothetical protein WA588_000120, partial [Blastocystis sp. NMH]
MSYNKYKGYYCLSWTSWILFILGGLTIGFGYLCERNPDLMATIHLHTYSDLMKYGGSVIAFWGFFGIISVCGGCILYLYSIVSVLFSVIFLTLFIISLVYTVQINVQGISGTTSVLIQEEFEHWVANNSTANAFQKVQYCLNCCGYKDLQKTHPNCDTLENCQVMLGRSIETVFIVITSILGVYLILFVMASIPACIRRKSYHRFH